MIVQKLVQNVIRLGALFLQTGFRGGQFFLCRLQFHLFGCQLFPGSFNLNGYIVELLEHFVVRRSDLVDHIHPIQQIGEAAGLKQNGPIGDLSVLLHGAHPLAVAAIELRLLRQRIVQLVLFFRNEQIIFLNLFIFIVNLFLGQGNGLVDLGLFLHQIQLFRLVAGDLRRQLLLLLGDLIRLILQPLQFFFDLTGRGSGGKGSRDDAEYHEQRQQNGNH